MAPQLQRAKGSWPALVLLGLTCLATACHTIDPDAASHFSTTVTTVKSQSDTALNAVAALTRDASISYAATQPTLTEANFVLTPTPETIAAWAGALGSVESYARNLAALSAPGRTTAFDVAATNLFTQFQQTAGEIRANGLGTQAGLNDLLATAFTETAGAILRARSAQAADKIAAATDTNITQVCELLATELGPDTKTRGLRKTLVEAVWRPKLNALTAKFLTVTNQNDRLTLAQQYADFLAKRDAEDQILAGLRRSLLALAEAHRDLAQGEAAGIQAELGVIDGELQHTRALFDQFSQQNPK
ncbi:MAG TPA: hypothetical protein VF607_07230 [Verrucomicrobiae bacterium]